MHSYAIHTNIAHILSWQSLSSKIMRNSLTQKAFKLSLNVRQVFLSVPFGAFPP
ncbi:hypothetical protein CEV31_4169 [Brucella thiophenivorans]|uniref:Uncharacterized protein n=1 Tax=Brucella thiophenivorans TaxID=571255 RepID=A0A256EXT3_9HYPH|nr:hypothetical protein CEV31_4169 [Brucella thiophenivorans]